MASSIHVKGDFYSRAGQRAGASAMAEKLMLGQVNGLGCYVTPPPRFEKAMAMGIEVDW